jgi:hypothetical protein
MSPCGHVPANPDAPFTPCWKCGATVTVDPDTHLWQEPLHVDIREATHVKTVRGHVARIVSKWGIDAEGHLAKPSEGGFGCITEDGERVPMMEANAYYALPTHPANIEFRLVDHSILPMKIVEIWIDGKHRAALYPHGTNAVRLFSNHIAAADHQAGGTDVWRFEFNREEPNK